MLINENAKQKLAKINWNSSYIMIDFDRTMTEYTSATAWGLIQTSGLMTDRYNIERKKLFEKYHPYEVDYTLDAGKKYQYMNEWFEKHMDLFIEYSVTEEIIDQSVKNTKAMVFRKGMKKLLEEMYNKSVPVIIMSAGITNIIKKFLKRENCYYDNIYICSNLIEFGIDEKIIKKEKFIHSLNKSSLSFDERTKKAIENRTTAIILGDHLADADMLDKSSKHNTIKIGFCEEAKNSKLYSEKFDIVCFGEENFEDIMNDVFNI